MSEPPRTVSEFLGSLVAMFVWAMVIGLPTTLALAVCWRLFVWAAGI